MDKIEDIEAEPTPSGELALQTIAMPKDTNANGDIFGGWLVSQMDLAAGITSVEVAKGRVATVAIENIIFLSPVDVGATVSCYVEVVSIGRSSMRLQVEVWIRSSPRQLGRRKVAEGLFVFVAIGEDGRTRSIAK